MSNSNSSSKGQQPPPRLHFDDGSRIITENITAHTAAAAGSSGGGSSRTSSSTNLDQNNPRGVTTIQTYYEINKIASQIVNEIIIPIQKQKQTNFTANENINENHDNNDGNDGFLCKVALQFPDELLNDAAQVSWLMEESIASHYIKTQQQQQQQQQQQHQSNQTSLSSPPPPSPLVFVLGDTTYSSCCPDEIGALHLNADVIVHYGQYACLSPSQSLPVIYSFGYFDNGWIEMNDCINCIQRYMDDQYYHKNYCYYEEECKFMLLCERRYHQYMKELAMELKKIHYVHDVIIGSIPNNHYHICNHHNVVDDLKRKLLLQCTNNSNNCTTAETTKTITSHSSSSSSCCCRSSNVNETCCGGVSTKTSSGMKETSNYDIINSNQCYHDENDDDDDDDDGIIIGGLKVSINPSSLSKYILLYIGDDSGDSKSRQFLNTILRCTSPTNGTKECWSYNPYTKQLSNDPHNTIGISRYLNRRFYLTQKAKLSSIMGILVGTLSQDRFKNVISTVRKKIEDSGRGCYTFVVGKINVAKLANFAEIECFVLISCEETSVLKDEREFHIPVITLSELDIVLGDKDWCGSDSCNTDFKDFLQRENDAIAANALSSTVDGQYGAGADADTDNEGYTGEHEKEEIEEEYDDDEPFFSMISGTYVSKPISESRKIRKDRINDNISTQNESSGGQIVEYKSKAAEFLKSREYQGLEAKIGQTEIKAATQGQRGIASDYGK